MNFSEPKWLLAGSAACLALLWLYRRGDARRMADLATFAAASLIYNLTRSLSPGRRAIKRGLVALAIACSAMALARPQWGFVWEETHRKGLDLLIAVDTSKSMLAQDVRPDRLTRAKMAVEDLLEKLEGDRVGLVAFAGTAFLQCPMTLDYDAFRQSLDALDVNVIPRGGTDIASAIHEAVAALEGKGEGERILVLLTDGEDLEGRALDAAREARAAGLKIFTVGVGSATGELVPVPDGSGGTTFARDKDGQFVKSRLDERMLRQIAEVTGGQYEPLGAGSLGLETIYEKGLAPFTRHDVASRMHKVAIERFQWPLAIALLCLVVEPLIGLRRRNAGRIFAARMAGTNALIAAWNRLARPSMTIALMAIFMGSRTLASTRVAEEAYKKGDYGRAAEAYGQAAAKNPDRPVLHFNQGAAEYKSGNFDAAAQAFSKALKSNDVKLQQDDYYNLGNAKFRIGQHTEKSDAGATIKSWEEAVQSYETALQLNPADADAKFNHDLVKRKLEDIKQQQQEQKQQQQQDQKQDQQQNPQQQPQQQGQKQDQQQSSQNQNQQQGDNSQHQNAQQQPQDKSGGATAQNSGTQQDQDKSANAPQEGGQGSREQPPKNDGQQAGDDRRPDQNDHQPAPSAQADGDQKDDRGIRKGKPVARNAQEPDGDATKAEAPMAPGEMSREEARQLLDSLKEGDRRMPLVPYARSGGHARDNEPVKDW
ncbi:MAG TPA: VWA domain-containing protein [Verrucomicrobiae bacterium]|nr:VWA domain-containing protein [Verrucomicrobiae bacterium]